MGPAGPLPSLPDRMGSPRPHPEEVEHGGPHLDVLRMLPQPLTRGIEGGRASAGTPCPSDLTE